MVKASIYTEHKHNKCLIPTVKKPLIWMKPGTFKNCVCATIHIH
jgi:hypothetical protein